MIQVPCDRKVVRLLGKRIRIKTSNYDGFGIIIDIINDVATVKLDE